MYKGKRVSLVFPAYNEGKNIEAAIKDFQSIKFVDEIVVVDNNSRDKTPEIAKKAGTLVVLEKNQGYGFALRRGMKEATGDLIVLCEPDATFSAEDLPRFLSLTDKFDLVTGTRTNKRYIRSGANMGFFLRVGNISVAKFMQLLYGLNNVSDCGCTFRVFKKSLVEKIIPHLSVGGSHFLPETVVLSKLAGGKIIEIPVHYGPRIGESKITGSFRRSVKVGLNMLGTILKNKINPPKLM
ncbi:MAG: hypothetical protein A3C30_00680 [Candidatus Levybacteria bacterium RIFCSPHIGHO2_02_FULL_40_18]|nr:MAG: hypothetical protein A2869_03250 [Candidatus Levybacteria bacterium RIFCSPHIGHO2_01_FULL_40_58]OGH27216.1 MAG: hypothetical protein A3C30_00680 [Candidatus Levybacteria bacterium RIFCSPHIGHO2_02_FULL_40_18]OGH31075.1 MAG: hypothetical protein A3E43_05095 [Candidatus Levybacteria bacterium RIFCSPHIGHO2_12_FULL_40_31]OGH40757.1 MAG: hypothetical protein A2894_03345 [Candidatus Levybacteria bacterium RIFCSPLOWO2_01_FULL_40_64]OGH49395.1 MAG: hypothetical protein A3I54_01985 [Candidatus Lev